MNTVCSWRLGWHSELPQAVMALAVASRELPQAGAVLSVVGGSSDER